MLKHVAVSPHRTRADSVSLSSSASCCSLGSLDNRHDSVTDLSHRTTTIKVYARRLRPDIEYKTLSVTWGTTAREVVATLLGKFRMRHRDPRLFYLSMEVRVRAAGLRTTLVLDDDARPAALQACHPKGYSKFSLQMRPGGLVKIYDSALMSSSQYKCLLTSERTTADELLAILLHCYDSTEGVERFSLYEVSPSQEYERKLHPDDLPLLVQRAWPTDSDCHFRVRRNPRAPPLPPLPPRALASTPAAASAEEPDEEPSRALSALSLESDEGKRKYSPVYKFPSISYCRDTKNDYLYI
ncbi:uncharacterized protein LOC115443280 isoform X1 [Manduca sexta]|uniref:Ras-associating domain-containing protein n=1 Tax=Manduca sexta TaxID=7130 RepID=A0A921YKR3_MANSE|nr:uncharacterized protein LOC115443280 isoform X1 [Manduca sexta]KAG6441120.1 hypothetical protein O3G_MSEX001659 [Manduca sexta]